jgi:hypothetical protein
MDVRYAKNGETSYHSMNDFESVAPAALVTTYSYDELRARCDENDDGAVDFCEMEMCIIAGLVRGWRGTASAMIYYFCWLLE